MLLHGELPEREPLNGFSHRIFEARAGAAPALKLLPDIPCHTNLMDVLRTCVSLLAHHDPQLEDNSHDAGIEKAERIISQAAEVIPAWFRVIDGKDPVPAEPGLSHAAQDSPPAARKCPGPGCG